MIETGKNAWLGAVPVSVIMSVHNEEKYVERAIQSILGQSLREIELVVIDNGSTDGTARILRGINDSRLRVLSQENRGLARALNRGINESSGSYIARIDADDFCSEDRLINQVDFLSRNPDYGIVGSNCRVLWQESERQMSVSMPESDTAIRRMIIWENPFIHSSVMIRRSALEAAGLYNPDFFWQDYELWWRILALSRGFNIQVELVTRLIRANSLSRSYDKDKYYREKVLILLRAKKRSRSIALIASIIKSYLYLIAHRILRIVSKPIQNA